MMIGPIVLRLGGVATPIIGFGRLLREH
jgi:hypothetical protein